MKVEIYADIVCPFCYIGKNIFAKFQEEAREEIEVIHRSYELDPNSSRTESMNSVEALAKKYGFTKEEAKNRMSGVEDMAKRENLPMNIFSAIGASTHDLHRLIYLAKETGKDSALLEAFYRAHFVDGIALNERDEVLKITENVGLKEEEVLEVLESDRYEENIAEDRAMASSLGITGVPFFVVDGKYGVSGAQPKTVFHQILESIKSDKKSIEL
ncbi:DsbA family oxidoreductase [Proteiniclasticum ruminis]|uniref:Predicted dithiol-disulfide isomerase, DsbA family n=1 Tax=Proteiniclasticum ruminis TaxID=398199 RepID=A0A1I4ZVC8_9CLOT|nr:DsbA family oxidoreductase [Proteiniclasticum ruminis]SFN54204.1 Predicted dithiol-disulfide isomerase, DsbA family [Proteiniclasticum ruminis]